MKFIPYGHQTITHDDINQVIDVLKSDYITQGPKVSEFENKLALFTGSKYCVVFNSGTAALHAAYFASGLSKNDEFITSPITFAATSNAGLYLGAKPAFCDIEADTGNIDSKNIERIINKKTKLIVPVHYGGHPVNLEKISEIAKKHKLLIIEDACHALGAKYKNENIGNCRYSDMAVVSFHPVKQITTGEGGAVFTNSDKYYQKLTIFRTHGITKDESMFVNANEGSWYHEMHYLGYNYRIPDILCAIGLSQLDKLPEFIKKRRYIASRYDKLLKDNQFIFTPPERPFVKSAYHLYTIRLKDNVIKYKKEVFEKLRQNNIGVQVHYIPVYRHPFYQSLGYSKIKCTNAEKFYQSEISIPMYPSLTDNEIEYVVDTLNYTLKYI